ncbi:phospholipase A1 member A [Helicoverpa armigera]|uniref:phospholipase A1 member A n=1 Tax=Helicoverpa armigera TaxID=29058 RepID=UPI003083899B
MNEININNYFMEILDDKLSINTFVLRKLFADILFTCGMMKMATLLFVAAALAVTASAVPLTPEFSEQRVYPRFIQFPDGEGILHDVDLEAQPQQDILDEISRNPRVNKYLLFTRRNPKSAQSLLFDNEESIKSSYFNPDVPTIVVAHGYLSDQNTEPNPGLRDTFLGKSDVNVIVIDWGHVARSDYVTAVRGVPGVGRALGQFLAYLNSVTGALFTSMHLIGLSLGAHVVGNAGRELGGKVARVTGLDPAGPLWNLNSNRISANDAIYVEAIHTDGGYLGIGSDVADADFYVNGGDDQPGCLTHVCSHMRSYRFFDASVKYNHIIGKECSSSLQITLNTCRGQELPLGNDDLTKFGSGRYRANTRRRYPY